jgi:hypothetical protein
LQRIINYLPLLVFLDVRGWELAISMEEGIQIRISGNKACAWKKHCTGHMNEIKLC